MDKPQQVLMVLLSYSALFIITIGCKVPHPLTSGTATARYIEISPSSPDWFQFSDGEPYIPIGINLINPSGRWRNEPDSAKAEVESWMRALSGHGGNYVRIWLSQSFWDMEEKQAGVYEKEKIARIDWFIATARKYGLRIKMTLEHFRSLTLEENPQGWAMKGAYHRSNGGPLDSIRQYLTTAEGHQLFLDKLDFYQQRYGQDTLFFGWELWNEMNAMKGPEDDAFWAWNTKMLGEVKKRFPRQLVMQSLGSFDTKGVVPSYQRMMLLPGNEVAQIHRYLDLGAALEICQGPMDMICASAVEDIKNFRPGKPILLAETGAVEPRHTGPSKYYARDTAGILLHDILFAPFFAGAAGVGMSWHWDSYVHKNNLWYHFQRFNHAIGGVNPLIEKFQPAKAETESLRLYILAGKKTSLIWLRDKSSDWRSELDAGRPAQLISSYHLPWDNLPIPSGRVSMYDPWTDQWSSGQIKNQALKLPDFRRSLVLKVSH